MEVLSASSRMGLLHPKVCSSTVPSCGFIGFHISPTMSFGLVYDVKLLFHYSNQETLGYVDIKLADVVNNRRLNEKYHLIDSKNGKVQIELQWRTA